MVRGSNLTYGGGLPTDVPLQSVAMTSHTTASSIRTAQAVDLTTPVLAALGNSRGVIAQACGDIVAAETARADAASRLRTGVEAADQAVGFILGGNLAGELAHRTDLASAIGCTPRQLDRAFSDPSNAGHCDRVLAAVDALVDAMAVASDGES